MSRISIDVDGVLANFGAGVIEAANSIWPGKIPEDFEPKVWDYTEVLTAEEFEQVWEVIKATENFWLKRPPYSENVGALARFFVESRDEDVFYVTSRVEVAGMTLAKQTDLWLASCGVRPLHNFMAVVPSGSSRNKSLIYKAMQMDFSIDDDPTTVLACEKVEGHRAYLLDRPWNQQAKVERRVFSLEEYLKDVVK